MKRNEDEYFISLVSAWFAYQTNSAALTTNVFREMDPGVSSISSAIIIFTSAWHFVVSFTAKLICTKQWFFFRQIDFDSIWTYNGRVNFPPWLGGSVTRFYFTAGKTTVSWGLNARRTKSLLGSKAEGCVDTSLLNNWAPHVMVFPIANKSNVLVLLSHLQC